MTRLEMVLASLRKQVDDDFVSWEKANVFGDTCLLEKQRW